MDMNWQDQGRNFATWTRLTVSKKLTFNYLGDKYKKGRQIDNFSLK